MGCSVHVNGRRSFGDWDGSSAIVRINEDGRATIITGEGEIGQGTLTVLRQIAAEELGLPYERRGHHAARHRRASPFARRAGEPRDLCRGQRGEARRRSRGQTTDGSRSGAVQAAGDRTHDHQRPDRPAHRPGDRVQAGQRGRARQHLQTRRQGDHRRRQLRQSLGISRPQPLRQRIGRLQFRGAGRGSRGRSRHRPGHAARSGRRGRLRHGDSSGGGRGPGAGRGDPGHRPGDDRILRLVQRRADRSATSRITRSRAPR